jgi:hypothetical protein
MQQPLISKAITPLDWIKMHPNMYHHPSLGPVLPQKLTMEMAGSPDNQIVGTN